MLLFIDNYDSFSWNLIRYFKELGLAVRVFANDAPELAVLLSSDLAGISGICVSPGPKTPAESGESRTAIQKAEYYGLPFLGVCLGHQCMAAHYGARITRAVYPMHGKQSIVRHHQRGLFADLPSELKVGRYHSLTVDPNHLPQSLRVDAVSQEDNSIMALSHRSLPHFGVQFHPESILSQEGHSLLANFKKLLVRPS